ncbi:hypothetical protein SAY87_004408 [Trapa incisa]|uniref:Calmodulin-binding protein n=1 Tax=Trapa incisa TaxID=236973 RepID=A0AAN7JNZ6_9MYRT|nr:hypothetical protein SAY87_004408 [Trapa incisa]
MKRRLQEADVQGFRVEVQDSKLRRFALSSLTNVIWGRSTGDIVDHLEPFLRSVVKDEVERAITNFHAHPSQRSLLTTTRTFEPEPDMELRFVGNLPSTVFTGSKIVMEDGNPIRLELFDAGTNRIVSAGPLSSLKVKIVVLNGDFGSDDQEYWTEKEFKANALREREGKRPLLNGELFVTLRGGVGHVGELAFTDNSSWVRSRKFRLGAQALQKAPAELRIREAMSKTFMVKDHRGELYKKHHPPHLMDEVWRLEKISRDGIFHRRLSTSGIYSVKDFLRLYETQPLSLRNILGPLVPSKTWEAIVEHANNCVVDDDKLYGYNQTPHDKHGLLFNSVYRVIGATFDGRFVVPLDKLTADQKVLVQNMKMQALKNLHKLFPVDALSTIAHPSSFSDPGAEPLLHGPGSLLQPLEFPIPHQGQLENACGLGNLSSSLSHNEKANENQSFIFPASFQNNHLQIHAINTTSGDGGSILGEFWHREGSVLTNDSSGALSAPDDHLADDNIAFHAHPSSWFH